MSTRESASKHLIMHTARSMAKENGWATVSVRKVADRIQYKAPILYEFFNNREDLIAQVLADGFRSLQESVQKCWRTSGSDSLVPISLEYWKFAIKNPEIYEAMNMFAGLKASHPELVRETRSFCQMVTEMIAEWAMTHSVREIDAKEATDILWALLHGIVSLGLMNQLGNKKAVEGLIAKSVSFFEAGLRK